MSGMRLAFILSFLLALGASLTVACGQPSPEPTRAPTPTIEPTGILATVPTPSPNPMGISVPGYHRDNALAIELGEVASFSITSPNTHVFEVQLEEGITYFIDVRLGTLKYSVAALKNTDGGTLKYRVLGRDRRASRIVWTATRSGSYFVEMYGPRDPGSYTLTVTEREISRPPKLVQQPPSPPIPTATPSSSAPPTLAGSPPPTLPSTPIPALVAFSETCSAVVPPDDAIQECSVHAIGPGRFTASIRTGKDEGFGWRVQVNATRRLPQEVVCNRTQGVGDGDVTCEVPEGIRTEVEIGGQLKSKVGAVTPAQITIKVDFLQYAAPPEPKPLAHSAVCTADKPLRTHQRCSVQAIGPGRFTASIRTGKDVGFRWRVQVNEVRRLPKEVVCNRTQGVGDGDVTCEVPEGTHTEVEISGTLLSNYGSANSTEITIKADFLQYAAPPEPKRLAHSAVCSAVVLPATHQRCSVHAIGPGRFTASIRTGSDVPYSWRVQVNDVRRLPEEVVCNRTQGVGDGDVTCDVPEGVRTEVEISGQLSSVGSGTPAEITIKVDFLQ